MTNLKHTQSVHYTLRIAVAMCFIGHGAFGIVTKPIWCNYFGVFGIGHDLSYQLMPLVGTVDILMGLIMLVYPVRAIPAWLVCWGIFTALLRPLSGEPFAEFIERSGNFGAPLGFLILSGSAKNIKGWFKNVSPHESTGKKTFGRLTLCLRIISFLLLLGHGWLNFTGKKALLDQYAAIGFADAMQAAQIIGAIEIAAAFIVLVKPFRPLILILFIWKMGTELFYPRYELFEWVERGGSYGVLLALWLVTEKKMFFAQRENKLAV